MKNMISPQEAAELLGVNVQTVRNFLKQDYIVGIRMGGRYKINKDSVEQFKLNGNPTAKNDTNSDEL